MNKTNAYLPFNEESDVFDYTLINMSSKSTYCLNTCLKGVEHTPHVPKTKYTDNFHSKRNSSESKSSTIDSYIKPNKKSTQSPISSPSSSLPSSPPSSPPASPTSSSFGFVKSSETAKKVNEKFAPSEIRSSRSKGIYARSLNYSKPKLSSPNAAKVSKSVVQSKPSVSVQSKPSVSVQSKPSASVQSKPSVSVSQSKPSVSVQSKQSVSVQSKPSVSVRPSVVQSKPSVVQSKPSVVQSKPSVSAQTTRLVTDKKKFTSSESNSEFDW